MGVRAAYLQHAGRIRWVRLSLEPITVLWYLRCCSAACAPRVPNQLSARVMIALGCGINQQVAQSVGCDGAGGRPRGKCGLVITHTRCALPNLSVEIKERTIGLRRSWQSEAVDASGSSETESGSCRISRSLAASHRSPMLSRGRWVPGASRWRSSGLARLFGATGWRWRVGLGTNRQLISGGASGNVEGGGMSTDRHEIAKGHDALAGAAVRLPCCLFVRFLILCYV